MHYHKFNNWGSFVAKRWNTVLFVAQISFTRCEPKQMKNLCGEPTRQFIPPCESQQVSEISSQLIDWLMNDKVTYWVVTGELTNFTWKVGQEDLGHSSYLFPGSSESSDFLLNWERTSTNANLRSRDLKMMSEMTSQFKKNISILFQFLCPPLLMLKIIQRPLHWTQMKMHLLKTGIWTKWEEVAFSRYRLVWWTTQVISLRWGVTEDG